MRKLREYEIEIKEELSKVVKIKAESLLEAYAAWNKAVKGEHFDKIKPL